MGNIGFSSNGTYNKGWGSLKNLRRKEVGDLYSSLSDIGDLVQSIFLVSVGEDTLNHFEYLKTVYLRRFVSATAQFSKRYPKLRFPSFFKYVN